jgi:RNA polymerase sigma factor (sigma-70 family)
MTAWCSNVEHRAEPPEEKAQKFSAGDVLSDRGTIRPGGAVLDLAALSDEELFELWRVRRKQDAFAQLEGRFRNELLGYARSRLARVGVHDAAGRAQDHVQETYLRLSLRTVALPSVRNWLYRVVGNLVTDELRKQGVGPRVLSISTAEQPGCEPADEDLDPLDELINAEEPPDIVKFWECVGTLPDHAWRLLVWHYVAGHGYEALVRLTGLKYSQVSMHLYEARKQLRKGYRLRRSSAERLSKRTEGSSQACP